VFKLDSPMLKIQDFILAILLTSFLYFYPLSFGSHGLKIFLLYSINSRFTIVVMALVLIQDMALQFISEKQLPDGSITKTIKMSSKTYIFSINFFCDVLSSIYICTMAFTPQIFFQKFLLHQFSRTIIEPNLD